jgi:hypothetical protein
MNLIKVIEKGLLGVIALLTIVATIARDNKHIHGR